MGSPSEPRPWVTGFRPGVTGSKPGSELYRAGPAAGAGRLGLSFYLFIFVLGSLLVLLIFIASQLTSQPTANYALSNTSRGRDSH